MARRKRSLFRSILVLGVLALAGFGLYTLYQNNKDSVDDSVYSVQEKAKAVNEALRK